MGMTLPGELTEPLGWIGLTWPEADEDLLTAAGQGWLSFAQELQGEAQAADQAAAAVWALNSGESVDAFRQWWTGDDGPQARFQDDVLAATLIGEALIVFAGVTMALKLAFIAQLVFLLLAVGQAIATAFVTFGATTAEIPVFVAAVRMACQQLIHQALHVIEHEIARILEQAAKLLKKAGARDKAELLSLKAVPFHQGSTFHGLMREVEHADVRSPPNGAIYYSGMDENEVRMRSYAEPHSDHGVTTTTLEHTPGGNYFDKLDLYNRDVQPVTQGQADAVWGRLSTRYAQAAEGNVTAYVHNPSPRSVWLNSELDALKNNPQVTGIKVIDPITGIITHP